MEKLWYPIFFLGAVLFVVYKYINKNHGYWKSRGVFYFRPLPIFGNFKDVVTNKCHIGEWLRNIYEQAAGQPYVGIYIFGSPVLVLRSPSIIKNVLQRDFNYFDNRTLTAPTHDKVMSNTLLMAKNPRWKAIRQKITPTYTSGKLKAMFPLIKNVSFELVEYMKKNMPLENFDTREMALKYTNQVTAKTAFAVDAGCFEDDDCEFRKWGRKSREPRFFTQMMIFFFPSMASALRLHFIQPGVKRFFGNVFYRSLELREKSGDKGNDLVDILLALKENDKERFWRDREVLLAQVFQIFFAGTETTARVIAYTLHELALQPDIQTKLREEIRRMLEENEGNIDYEQLLSLKYLDMCICETTRKYPALPFLDRMCGKDYKVEETGLIIDKGTKVFIPMVGLSYDASFFPNPGKYDPERFKDRSKINNDGLHFVPFGEGPRICIGERFAMMSAKLALAQILTNFEVEPSSQTHAKPKLVKNQIFLVPETIPLTIKMIS